MAVAETGRNGVGEVGGGNMKDSTERAEQKPVDVAAQLRAARRAGPSARASGRVRACIHDM